ncbi:hypothetical protein L6452_30692 [Arctium lappa]|uniref:Uncharacterized protein n=1 Tax=Arctium lappa TaxID=4217 RepID=A0ACB8ZJ24_ARCLA|nr:hypothetical protein L6452_30692 [Arctium lappa]
MHWGVTVGFKRKPIISGSREDLDQPEDYDDHKLNGIGNLVERSFFVVVAIPVINGVEEGFHTTYFSSDSIVWIRLLVVTATIIVVWIMLLLVTAAGVTDDFWVIDGSSGGSMLKPIILGSREDPDQPGDYDEHELNIIGNLVERSSFVLVIRLSLVTVTVPAVWNLLLMDDFWVIAGSSGGSMLWGWGCVGGGG